MTDILNPLVTIIGPTGSGKSDLALAIAHQFSGEIINCDSLQIFRYFEIGTAKLMPGARQGIPHHLIDVCNPDALMTAGEYARLAREALKDVTNRKKLPIVCGGTGFYLKALIEGLSPSPERDDKLRDKLAKKEAARPGAIHRILKRLDAEAAGRIHAQDVNKTMRALEIRISSGKAAKDLMAGKRDALEGYRILKIVLNPPRPMLHQRLNQRCVKMFRSGLLDEIKSILARGYPESSKPFESIGYRECLALCRGDISAADALEKSQTHSRQYAKRQLTWFRRDPEVVWLPEFGDTNAALASAADLVKRFLEPI